MRSTWRIRGCTLGLACGLALAQPMAAGAEPPAVRPLGEAFTLPVGNPCGAPSTAIVQLRRDVALGVWVEPGEEVRARFFHLDGTPFGEPFPASFGPAVADSSAIALTDGRGGFAVLWADAEAPRVLARTFAADGSPRAAPFLVATGPPALQGALAADGALATVTAAGPIEARWFDPLGNPQGSAVRIAAPEATADERWDLFPAPPRIDAAGDLVVTWERRRSVRDPVLDVFFARDSEIEGATVGRDGSLGPVHRLAGEPHLLVELRTGGGHGDPLWASWVDTPGPGQGTDRLLRLDPRGAPVGPPVTLEAGVGEFAALAHLAVEPGGAALAVYHVFDDGADDLAVQAFAVDGSALRAGQRLGLAVAPDLPSDPALVSEPGGVWTVLWQNALPVVVTPPPPCAVQPPVFARRFAPGCLAGDRRLCLAGERFAVAADWEAPQHGTSGPAHATPLTGDTGAFWFFRDANVELLLKILDARPLDGGFWVFYGSLSNVGFTVEVTDTETQRRQVYDNPAGTFASQADLGAFPQFGPAGSGGLGHLASPAPEPLATPRITPPLCTDGDPERLCLLDRFTVEVDWLDPRSGDSGRGRAAPLATGGDTGLFWFFDAANLELAVKILDGRPANGHFWVFFGALTDVEFRLTVTDGATGAVRRYDNPGFTMASRGDTAAFPEAP